MVSPYVVFSVGFFTLVPLWIVAKATSQRQENLLFFPWKILEEMGYLSLFLLPGLTVVKSKS
jgi:hypothetical protein